MSYLLSQTPAAALSGGLVSLAQLRAGNAVPEVADDLLPGQVGQLLGTVNAHAGAIDALARASCGAYGILSGLVVSSPGGLVVALSNGMAVIDGVVEAVGVPNLTLPANTPRIWLWLTQAGTWAFTTSATPPVGKVLYLGSVVTNASAVASIIQTHGVVRLEGGAPWTSSADVGAPTVGASIRGLHCQTLGGLYVWNGTSWHVVREAAQSHVMQMPRAQMPTGGFWMTLNGPIPTGATAEQTIWMALCAATERGRYRYRGWSFYGGLSNLTGSDRRIQSWLVEANPTTGNPARVCNPAPIISSLPANVESRWAHFAYGATDTEIDLRDNPFFWWCMQVPSSGFTGGTIGVWSGAEAGHFSSRVRDTGMSRTGTPLSFAGGLPMSNGAVDLTNCTFADPRPFYHTDAATSRLCHLMFSLWFQRVG